MFVFELLILTILMTNCIGKYFIELNMLFFYQYFIIIHFLQIIH